MRFFFHHKRDPQNQICCQILNICFFPAYKNLRSGKTLKFLKFQENKVLFREKQERMTLLHDFKLTNSQFNNLTFFSFGNFQFWQLSILTIFNFCNLTTQNLSNFQYSTIFDQGNSLFWQLSIMATSILATFKFGNFWF